ncbi:MAG: hypothetical protein PHQ95_03045 [Candidatus Gracilibacteria bacterium]|nr:hypothetical protein [Candidatus Gracilibacteria bacterium]
MIDVYVCNPETEQIMGCVSFSPLEFDSIGRAFRLLGQTEIHIKNTTGAVEGIIVGPESIKIIH